MNRKARAFRANPRGMTEFPKISEIVKGAIVKSELDVGTLTNFAQITGGQSLGYVSLDTMMARGTVRPSSFTLYQCLEKTAANQIVDYWAYASDTGGGLPGTAFQSYTSAGTGTLATNAGDYNLNYITLKLALDGRAITVALAAQNSFVNVAEQENTNAALTVLESINWGCYWGNSALYANQFDGIATTVTSKAPANVFDFQAFATQTSGRGWSPEQTMFNLIYEAAADITSYRTYGVITHAFMTPTTAASMQTLVTGVLNNIVAPAFGAEATGIVVDGDLRGMKTRFGAIQFPVDLFIGARDLPAQARVNGSGVSYATSSSPTPPASVSVAVSGVTGSDFSAAYVASSGDYVYAVASTNGSMQESTLVYGAATGITAGQGYAVTIAPPVAADATVFRVYRSGLGTTLTGVTGQGYTAQQQGTLFRYVGSIAANGTNSVVFVDLNTTIPGSDSVFLLDMDEADKAIDFRYLLPLSRINLFAQSLYQPWAVATIGSIRLKIAKFHGLIRNYVPSNPNWNPLSTNAPVLPNV
ncbi:MAG: hypothetical protein KGI54_14495 [Pseudomonadota bacterium]|nr:hypothetical protein [Pseudomonadota bacterium]